MTPIIFLDFDGVLNSEAWSITLPTRGVSDEDPENPTRVHESLDPAAVARVNEIIRQTSAKVVVSSSWRLGRSAAALQRILTRYGFIGEVIDKTPRSERGLRVRGHEICAWLHDHWDNNRTGSCDRQAFVMIDDDSDAAHLYRNLVQTNWKTGLVDADVARAVAILTEGR